MSLIAKSTIQEVNNRLDAISIIGDYVKLEKKSGRFWGRCPFHGGGQEKTPSFKVDPDLKMYHCFGCGKGGSAIGFVMEMDKLTYPEAIKNLARKMNIEIVYEEGKEGDSVQETSIKEELFELYRRTAGTFHFFLKDKEDGQNALKYLEDRGVNKEMIDAFKLGFAPEDRDFLFKFLKQKNYSDDFLEKSGLFSSRYKTIPLFNGRLMFPITDRQGRIVAFGGRFLPGLMLNDGREPPKYINSPETEIYKKGQTLYAIDQAKPEMRKTKTAFLAEGYLDVIALHQAGITNAVAPLGTAFTDEQASWLRRWVERVVLIFDNDEAGFKAAYKAIITCRKNGLSCLLIDHHAFLVNETGGINKNFKDPAEILQEFGPEILKKISNYTINDFEYLISVGVSHIESERGKLSVTQFLFPFLDSLDSEVERTDYIARIADIIRIERKAVQNDYVNRKKEGKALKDVTAPGVVKNRPIEMNAEIRLLAVVALNMELYFDFRKALEIKEIDDEAAKELFIALEECFQYGENGMDSLLARIKNEPLKSLIVSRGDSPEFRSNARRFMEDGVNNIKIKRKKKRLDEIGAELREIERKKTDADINELLAEKKEIDIQIRKLEGRQ